MAVAFSAAAAFAPVPHHHRKDPRSRHVLEATDLMVSSGIGEQLHLAANAFHHLISPHIQGVVTQAVSHSPNHHNDAFTLSQAGSKLLKLIDHGLITHGANHHHNIYEAPHPSHHQHNTLALAQAGTDLLKSYGNLLHDHPIPTKMATATILAAGGDAIAQRSQDTYEEYDLNRGASFAIFGAVYTGAFQHFWFDWLNHNLASSMSSLSPTLAMALGSPSAPTVLAMSKMGANQFLMVPFVYMPLFFLVTGALQGLSTEQTTDRAKELYTQIIVRNWAFWLPAQFVQFNFVSPDWQIPYLCAMGLVWTFLLSSVGGSSSSASASTGDNVAQQQLGEAIEAVAFADVTLTDVGDAIADAAAPAVAFADVALTEVGDAITDATAASPVPALVHEFAGIPVEEDVVER